MPKPSRSDPPPSTTGNRMLRLAGIIAINALIVVVVLSLPGATQALTLATTRQTEPFTELYFSDPQALPTQIAAGTTATIAYTVVNHESTGTTYAPEITVEQGSGQAAHYVPPPFYLATGQKQLLTYTFTPTIPDTTATITINLPASHLSIHYRSKS